VFAVAVVFAGCGRGGPSVNDGATVNNGESATLDDPACARFGLKYAPTCDACPTQPLTCPCFATFDSPPLTRCLWGRCLLSVDCATVCKNASMDFSSPKFNDFADDLRNVTSCVNQRRCLVDSSCGTGKCVGETSTAFGWCRDGYGYCEQPNDCWSGMCVQTVVSRSCQDGKAGSMCSGDPDCPQGHCIGAPPEVPLCTRGQLGDPCRQASDCTAGPFCVHYEGGPFGLLGVCLAGRTDDHCTTNGECQNHACIDGTCRSGLVGAECQEARQCETRLCTAYPPNIPTGLCTDGVSGARCYKDGDCLGHHCALRPFDPSLGVCTDGKVGDPCRVASDCNALPCTVPRPPEPYRCSGQPGAATCSGTCGGDSLCYYGHCGT
jgi:hypothetical protein